MNIKSIYSLSSEKNVKTHKANIWAVTLLLLLLCPLLAVSVSAGAITYTYDNAGRLVKADYGGGKSITYTYDNNGNLLERNILGQAPKRTLTTQVDPIGSGTITGNGINCPGDCTQEYDHGTNVQLTANKEAAFVFLGWGGDLEGATNPDTVTMNSDKEVIAYFGLNTGNTDTDGVPDGTESGPNRDNPSYDGDGNGIPDYHDPGAVSLNSSTGGAYVTIAVPVGQILNDVQAVDNPSPENAPAGVTFPYGFFEFTIIGVPPGTCTTVTLYLPKNTGITTYYKYGPTPADPTNHWYEFMFDGQTGAQIFHEATQTRIVLHFCDGKRGDDDLTINDLIIDQGGPGGGGAGAGLWQAQPIPTLTQWGMIIFMLSMAAAGLLVLLRRQRHV